MNHESGRKTDQAHWDSAWRLPVRPRLPSRLNVGVLNTTRLLEAKVRPGDRYLEVGCAPGKILAWVYSKLGARAAGLDYSDTGVRNCRELFAAMALPIDLYQDDFFANSLPKHSFDVVASFGFIEHFDDPREVVAKHIELVKPGGIALIVIPNYGSIYGSLQRRCDPANLELHNLNIMNPVALAALVDSSQVATVTAYPSGSMSPYLVNLHKKLPTALAGSLTLIANGIGLLQPFIIEALAPTLVLEVRTKSI